MRTFSGNIFEETLVMILISIVLLIYLLLRGRQHNKNLNLGIICLITSGVLFVMNNIIEVRNIEAMPDNLVLFSLGFLVVAMYLLVASAHKKSKYNYSGGGILLGHLVGTVDETGTLDMRYHHVNENGDLMTGVCISTPEILDDGRIRIYERWQWTCKDQSIGHSIIEEVRT